MDEVERISFPLRPETQRSGAPPHGAIVLSVNRGFGGEVSAALRSVRVRYDAAETHLDCYFAGAVAEADVEAMQVVSSSVAADFPDKMVFEHCIASDLSRPLSTDDRSAIVFARREQWD